MDPNFECFTSDDKTTQPKEIACLQSVNINRLDRCILAILESIKTHGSMINAIDKNVALLIERKTFLEKQLIDNFAFCTKRMDEIKDKSIADAHARRELEDGKLSTRIDKLELEFNESVKSLRIETEVREKQKRDWIAIAIAIFSFLFAVADKIKW
jgi:hypothetical protein